MSDWKETGKAIAATGLKAIGAALGGPFGATVGGQLADLLGCEPTPESITTSIKNASPETLVKLKELETSIKTAEIEAEKHAREMDSKDIETVNATMQTESKSEKWPQWSWRPFNGFMFGITMFSVYFMIPLINAIALNQFVPNESGMIPFKIDMPEIDYTTWLIWGSILGVTSMGRNTLKVAQKGKAEPTILGSIATRIKGDK